MAKILHNLLCRLGVHVRTPYGPRRFICYASDYCRGRVHYD